MALKKVIRIVGLSVILVAPLAAHHAVATVYDLQRTTTIQGVANRIVVRRPHPVVHLVVQGVGVISRTWVVEFDDPDTRRA